MAHFEPSSPHCPPRTVVFLSLLLAIATTAVDSAAQSGSGRAVRLHWPDMLFETQGAMDVPFTRSAEQFDEAGLLPAIDSLVLDYAWAVDGEVPRLGFDLSWAPGAFGVVDGTPVDRAGLPDSLVLHLVDLRAEVWVDGARAGDLVLTLDSLALPPDPYVYSFDAVSAAWDSLFAGMDAAAARTAFERGFELRNLDILRIAFVGYDFHVDGSREVRVVRRVPRRRAVFVPEPDIWIAWNLGPDPYAPPPRRPARGAVRPRGDDSGRQGGRRGSAGRGSERVTEREREGGSILDAVRRAGDSDDDDDDRELLGPAIGAVAAVGALAVIAGSVGLAGWSDAPLGVAGGRMTNRWGMLAHAAVSGDVVSGGPDEVLRAGVTAYGRPLFGRLHPGLGMSVRLHEVAGSVRSEFGVEVGAAARFGRLFVLAGVDAVSGAGRFGLVVAIRDPRR